jgi:hypothetical protein
MPFGTVGKQKLGISVLTTKALDSMSAGVVSRWQRAYAPREMGQTMTELAEKILAQTMKHTNTLLCQGKISWPQSRKGATAILDDLTKKYGDIDTNGINSFNEWIASRDECHAKRIRPDDSKSPSHR